MDMDVSADPIPVSDTVKLLMKWNFSEEVQLAFVNAGTQLDEFLNIGLQKLQDFVPDDDERLRLITCILKLKRTQVLSQPKDNVKSNSPESASPLSDHDPDFVLDDEVLESYSSESEDYVHKSKKKKSSSSASSRSLEVRQNNHLSTIALTSHSQENRPLSEPSAIPSRLQGIVAKNKFQDLNLQEYLQAGTTTASVLVGNINGVLTPDKRKILTTTLAEFILNHTTSPTPEDFKIIREKIYELFPNEPEGLYYIAPRESGSHQRLARGKLYDRVRNRIGKLIKGNALAPRRKKRSALEDSQESSSNQEDSLPATEVQAAIVVLKRSREVTADVEEKWIVSADFRLKQLYRHVRTSKPRKHKAASAETENDKPDVIVQYFNEYKILRHPKGYTLLVSDFKHLHESGVEKLFTVWPDLQQKLEVVARSKKIDDTEGIELVTQIKQKGDLLDANNKDAVLLQLLPSLCPPTARVKVGKKSFKPSIVEARSAFICYVTNGADIEPLIERRRKRMSDLQAPLQPYMIFQGPTRSVIIAVYVVFDNVLYRMDSVLHCVDTCFKLYHVLCASYPQEANHLWHFFHLYVYEIKHDPALEGEVPMSTKAFIATIKSA